MDLHQCIRLNYYSNDLGSKASPKPRQRNERVHKTKQKTPIIFIFTMQTYKVKDLINVLYDNGIDRVRIHVRKSQIQGLFKDIQGHGSANSRTKY